MSATVAPVAPSVEMTAKRVLAVLVGIGDAELSDQVAGVLRTAVVEAINEGALDSSDVVLTTTLSFEVTRGELAAWLSEWAVS